MVTKREKPLRADGARNRERIVAIATELVARDGAQVSLEEIARSSGIGSATLHRHFPSRWALLEAVFREGVERLCARTEQPSSDDAGTELTRWLEELTVYIASHRGLAAALLAAPGGPSPEEICCTDRVSQTLEVLVRRARRARALRPSVATADLLLLANAIGAATEHQPEVARRLVRLALDGAQAVSSSGR